ncbi:hypothetical protein ES703_40144 [subsurface metagenome]
MERHIWAWVGLDANRRFEGYADATGDIYLVGYAAGGITFFDDAGVGIKPSAIDVWQTKELAASCPGAIGIIFEILGMTSDVAIRKKGSSDNYYERTETHQWGVVGCDEQQRVEVKAAYLDANRDIYVIGYITAGCYFRTNGKDIKVATDAAWHDKDLLTDAPDGIIAFIERAHGSTGWLGLRRKGETGPDADVYEITYDHTWAMVAMDANGLIQIKMQATDTLNLIGWAIGH